MVLLFGPAVPVCEFLSHPLFVFEADVYKSHLTYAHFFQFTDY